MEHDETRLVASLADAIDGLRRYRADLEATRNDLLEGGLAEPDPDAVAASTRYLEGVLAALQPLEMQLGAVARQADSLRSFAGLDVDLGAISAVDRTGTDLTALARTLAARLRGFAGARAGLSRPDDIDAQLERVDRAIEQLEVFAAVDVELQGAYDGLVEPLRAHREAVLALEESTRSVVETRRRHGKAHAALRDALAAVARAGGSTADDDAPPLPALAADIEAFEAARAEQLAALDALGFDGLDDRLTAFEEARANEIPDFRAHRLDGLRGRVAKFTAVCAEHRETLDRPQLGDLERDLTRLRAAGDRQQQAFAELLVDTMRGQLAAVDHARARQYNAVSALSLDELQQRFAETAERLISLGAQIAAIDLRDPATAPPLDEDDVF